MKQVLAFFLIFIFLLGIAQLFVPRTEGQQNFVVDRSYWLGLANNAWKYFQPGVGIDSTTGLHSAGLGFPYLTDWDLGIYIQSIIAVNQMGILSASGTWGSDARFTKVLAFLQTRQLTSNGVPYAWYHSDSGNPNGTEVQNAADAGQLLVALNNLKVFRPDLADAINNVVYNRTNYEPLEKEVDGLANSKNIYDYYVASGFAGFWPSRFSTLANSILNNIASAPAISTYGAILPSAKLTGEPLLLSVFNLAPNVKLNSLVDQVYSAHEARYNATGKFTAFSEGNTGLDNPPYVYEWVVKEDGSTWTIEDISQVKVTISPIIYFKTAVGLLALHDTSFTENMASYIGSHLPNPSNGYSDGIDENGRVDTATIDKTNGMIIEAANYAIKNLPTSTPTPTVTPNPSPSPTSTSSPQPTPSPTATPPSDQTTAKLQAAATAVDQSFSAILGAQRAGANVTDLLSQLNYAQSVLASAQNSYRSGDLADAGNQADHVVAVAEQVTSLAQNAEQAALASGESALLITIALTVVGSFVFVVVWFLVWRKFKRRLVEDLPEDESELVYE
jgi:hypothetical protein